LSKFKSSGEILDNFGYYRGEDLKLYCTVSISPRNQQGLILIANENSEFLIENSDKKDIGDFLVWSLETLHKRLIEKHSETFWVATESKIIDGNEYFHYTKVEHTKKPILTQFDTLLRSGDISVDHLIKRKPSGSTAEKGPIFKIKPKALSGLFPPSQEYDLL
jgi:hypothetical protein